MNFTKLFKTKNKEDKKSNNDKIQITQEELDKKIEEQELKIANLQTKADVLQKEAKEKLKAGDKSSAVRLLAKKKKYLEQIKQIEGTMLMMEEQKMMLDNTINLIGVFKTIKKTNEILKEQRKDLKIEDLEKIKEEMEEAKDEQEEIKNFFTDFADENTEDVQKDLEDLEEEIIKEEQKNNLPNANKEELYQNKSNRVKLKNEEDELAKILQGN